jgi:ribosomal protein L32
MAVPKKKMSKSKTNSRKSSWKKKLLKKVLSAISFGKSYLKKNKDMTL